MKNLIAFVFMKLTGSCHFSSWFWWNLKGTSLLFFAEHARIWREVQTIHKIKIFGKCKWIYNHITLPRLRSWMLKNVPPRVSQANFLATLRSAGLNVTFAYLPADRRKKGGTPGSASSASPCRATFNKVRGAGLPSQLLFSMLDRASYLSGL